MRIRATVLCPTAIGVLLASAELVRDPRRAPRGVLGAESANGVPDLGVVDLLLARVRPGRAIGATSGGGERWRRRVGSDMPTALARSRCVSPAALAVVTALRSAAREDGVSGIDSRVSRRNSLAICWRTVSRFAATASSRGALGVLALGERGLELGELLEATRPSPHEIERLMVLLLPVVQGLPRDLGLAGDLGDRLLRVLEIVHGSFLPVPGRRSAPSGGALVREVVGGVCRLGARHGNLRLWFLDDSKDEVPRAFFR